MGTYFKLILTAVFWGGTFIAGRVVVQNVGPFSAAFLRFFVASAFLIVLTKQIEGTMKPLKRNQVVPVIFLGLTGVFAYNIFFLTGLKTVSASRASLIIAANPVFIALIASLIFKETLKLKNYLGIILCASGAMVVISHGDFIMLIEGGLGRGEVFIAGCVASWVAYSIIGKAVMSDMFPMTAVTYSCVIGAAGLLIPACLFEGMFLNFATYRAVDWISITYLGFFGTALGFSWFYQGIQAIGPSRAGIFINLVPVSAVVMAYFILDEKLDTSLFVGAVMVIMGAYLTNIRRKASNPMRRV